MPNIEPYKEIFISQPTGEGGILIQSNFKKLADLNAIKTAQIASISASYSLKTETNGINSALNSEIDARIAGDNIVFNLINNSVETINSTINDVSGSLQTQISSITADGSLIYTISTSGTVLRTQQSRNRDFINVQDFNGVFQAAINTLDIKGGHVYDTRMSTGIGGVSGWQHNIGTSVHLGAVNYGITSPIILHRGSDLIGSGSNSIGGTLIHPDGVLNIGDVITNVGSTSVSAYAEGMHISNMRIDGNKATNNGNGVFLSLMGECSEVHSLFVTSCKKSGIVFSGKAVPVRCIGTSCFYNDEYGFNIDLDTDADSAGTALFFDTLSGDDNVLGLMRIANGNDRSVVTIYNLKAERHGTGVHDPVIVLENFTGILNIVGMHIFSATGLPNATCVIKIIGSGTPKINIFGATHRLYTAWIQDDVQGQSVYTQGNYLHGLHYGYEDRGYKYININGFEDCYVGGSIYGNPTHKIRYKTDANSRLELRPGGIYFGDGTNPIDADIRRLALNILGTTSTLMVENSAWNAGVFRLGDYRLWVDGSGKLRIKNSDPISDTDGTVVGTQS